MMKITLLFVGLFLTGAIVAQEGTPPPSQSTTQQTEKSVVLEMSDVDPELQEVLKSMQRYVQQNISYPMISMENGDQGRVYVSFVLEPDGSISNAEVTKGVTPELDAEAMRLVQNLPQQNAGTLNGSAVRVRCHLPITFTLVD